MFWHHFKFNEVTSLQKEVLNKGICHICHKKTMELRREFAAFDVMQCVECLRVYFKEKEEERVLVG